jgi:2-oxoglutarate ferredoxin oxidoreductase subunit alpha
MQKISGVMESSPLFDWRPCDGADTLLIAYGVTARAANTAVRSLAAEGKPVSLLCLKSLWPVPEQLIRDTARSYRRVVVVEMNLGQYVREIQRVLPGMDVSFFGQMNGELITPQQIREVLRHG